MRISHNCYTPVTRGNGGFVPRNIAYISDLGHLIVIAVLVCRNRLTA